MTELVGGGGGALGSADFTAGLAISDKENVKLGEDSKIYPSEFSSGTLLNTGATSYTDSFPFKTVEVSTDNLVTVGGSTFIGAVDGLVYGSTLAIDVITNNDVEEIIWDASVETIDFKGFDITPIASGTDQFAAVNDRSVGIEGPEIRFGDYNGISFSIGTTVRHATSGGSVVRPSIVDLGINGPNNVVSVIGKSNDTTVNIKNYTFTNATGSNTAVSGNLFDSAATSARANSSQTPADRMQDGFSVAVSVPNLDGGFHNIHFMSETASLSGTSLDVFRGNSGRKPIGVLAESSTELLVVAVSGWDFDQDQVGFSGVTNPVDSSSGEVLGIYAVTVVQPAYTSLTIGTPLKLDPIISEQLQGNTPIHILKDANGNFNISYNGIVHTVSVNFGTRVVALIRTGVDKRHDSISQPAQSFSGSTYDAASTSLSTVVPIADNRFMYSDNSQAAGAIILQPEEFLSAGALMPIGIADAAIAKGAIDGTVLLDSRLRSHGTSPTTPYVVGSLNGKITSTDNKNLVVSENRAITASVIAENLPEFESISEYPNRSDCFLVDLVEFGWILDLSTDNPSGLFSKTLSLTGLSPTSEFLNIKGSGILDYCSLENATASTNVPDYDLIIDGELVAFQRDETKTGAATFVMLVGTSNASVMVRDLPEQPFKKSLIIKARNTKDVASAQNITVSARVLLEK